MAAAADDLRAYGAEAIGTAMLLATVVGSGIMAERLAGGNVAVALLANAIATGAGLVAILLTLGPVSGAHLNPAVTLVDALAGKLPRARVPGYLVAQIVGAFAGVVGAHAMFGERVISMSTHARTGPYQWFSEVVATFGLVLVIRGVSRARPTATPFAVAAYITAAYWFTASTSFANPVVTLARAFTDTFAGIRLEDVAPFAGAQIAGALLAEGLSRFLFREETDR